MSAKEIEFEMKNHSKKKASAPKASLGNSVKDGWRKEQQSHTDPSRWWRGTLPEWFHVAGVTALQTPMSTLPKQVRARAWSAEALGSDDRGVGSLLNIT